MGYIPLQPPPLRMPKNTGKIRTNCRNCGAPLKSPRCLYCGTEHRRLQAK